MLAGLALLVNIRFKLPKKVFLLISVLTVVATSWVAMNPSRGTSYQKTHSCSRNAVSSLIAEYPVLNPGVNEFPLSFHTFDDSCKGANYSLSFLAGQGESEYPDCIVILRTEAGECIDCAAYSFAGNVLKSVFVFPPEFDYRKIAVLKIVCKVNLPLKLESITEEKIFN